MVDQILLTIMRWDLRAVVEIEKQQTGTNCMYRNEVCMNHYQCTGYYGCDCVDLITFYLFH